jgi:hypothetical protein
MYHREMLGEDLSGRFDYLFEPLEVDDSAGDGNNVAPQSLAEPENRTRWPSRLVLAGLAIATMAAAAATAIALLRPAQPDPQILIPGNDTPLSTTASTPVPPTPAEPVPVLPATAGTSAPSTTAATPPIVPQQPSSLQEPTTVASEPPGTMPPPPTTRAPISVSPESRVPFPNQTPPRKNEQGGGLLGGLL